MAGMVQTLLVELDARTAKLEAALAKSQSELLQFKRNTADLGESGSAMGDKYARGALHAAGALETMARSGNVAGEGAKALIARGSEIAFAFGAGGAVVGAFGVATLAIVQLFTRARDEAEKTQKALADRMKEIARAGKDAVTEQLNDETKKLHELEAKMKQAKAIPVESLTGSTAAGVLIEEANRTKAVKQTTDAYNAQAAVVDGLWARLKQLVQIENDAFGLEREKQAGKTGDDAETAAIIFARNVAEARATVRKAMAEAIVRQGKEAADAVKTTQGAITASLDIIAKYAGTAVDKIREAFDKQIEANKLLLAGAAARGDAESVAKLTKTNDELEKARDLSVKWQKAVDDVGGSMKDIGNAAAGAEGHTAKTATSLAEQARAIEEAARGALDLANAFGLVDATTTKVLQSVVQIAANIPALSKALGAGSGAGFGAIAAAALPIVGGIAAIIAGIFGRGKSVDPQVEAARQAEIKAAEDAAAALALLAKNAGDLAHSSFSGGQIGGATSAVSKFFFGAGGIAPYLTGAIGAGQFSRLSGELKDVGLSFKDLQDIAKELGLTLSNMPKVEEINNLRLALQNLDLKAFADTFTGQLDALHRGFEVFGTTNPFSRLRHLMELLMQGDVGAPDLFGAFRGINVASAGGIDQARGIVQSLFEKAQSGNLTPEQLGGMTLQQFLDSLSELTGYLNDAAQGIADAAQAAADAAKRIADAQEQAADYIKKKAEDTESLQARMFRAQGETATADRIDFGVRQQQERDAAQQERAQLVAQLQAETDAQIQAAIQSQLSALDRYIAQLAGVQALELAQFLSQQLIPGATAPTQGGEFNTAVSRATASQADRMVDELTAIRTILDDRLVPPSIIGWGSGGSAISIEQSFTFTGNVDVATAQAVAGVITDEMLRAIDAYLGRRLANALTNAGSSLVS